MVRFTRRHWSHLVGAIFAGLIAAPPLLAGLSFTWTNLPSSDGQVSVQAVDFGSGNTNNQLQLFVPLDVLINDTVTINGTVSGHLGDDKAIVETLRTSLPSSDNSGVSVYFAGGTPQSNQFFFGNNTPQSTNFKSTDIHTEQVRITFTFAGAWFSSASSTPYTLTMLPN